MALPDAEKHALMWYDADAKSFYVAIPESAATFTGNRLPQLLPEHLAMLEIAGQLNTDETVVPRLADMFINRLGGTSADARSSSKAGH